MNDKLDVQEVPIATLQRVVIREDHNPPKIMWRYYLDDNRSSLAYFTRAEADDAGMEALKAKLAEERKVTTPTKKHDVHLYCEVRVKICGVEATDHADACSVADEATVDHLNQWIDRSPELHFNSPDGDKLVLQDIEYTGGIDCMLVDVEGDEDYVLSSFHTLDRFTCAVCGYKTDYPVNFGQMHLNCPECDAVVLDTKEAQIRKVLEANDGLCMDVEEERERLMVALLDALRAHPGNKHLR